MYRYIFSTLTYIDPVQVVSGHVPDKIYDLVVGKLQAYVKDNCIQVFTVLACISCSLTIDEQNSHLDNKSITNMQLTWETL